MDLLEKPSGMGALKRGTCPEPKVAQAWTRGLGGFAFGSSSNNVDQKPRLSYMNATLWADVKPTTVVVS